MRWVASIALVVIGCSSPLATAPDGVPDATVRDGHSALHDAARAIDATARAGDGGVTCMNQVTTGNDQGHHNAGMDCMDGCHDHGFTLAGTLYTSSAGSTIVSGATIAAVDAFGNEFDMVSMTNGNFYTSFAITYPIAIYASECPTIQKMTMTINDSSMIGCNQSACHASGSTQGRVHLP